MLRKYFLVFASLLFVLPELCAQLTLDDYLKKVDEANPELKSINSAIEASQKKILELDMVYSPMLNADINYMDDKSGISFQSPLYANEIKSTSWDISASKKFDTGSTLSLGYRSYTAQFNLLTPFPWNGANLSNFTGYELQPYIKFQQSLLQDLRSGLTNSGIRKSRMAAKANEYLQVLKRQQLILQAKLAYWTLSLAREVVAFRKASMDRTEKLLHWNENKYKVDLLEKVDLLQAQAAYKTRVLNYQLALENEIKASRDFNGILGIKNDTITDDIDKISNSISLYQNIAELKKTGKRADVLSAESSLVSAKYAQKETDYRNMPELSFLGSYSLNGLDIFYNNAWDQVANSDKPTYSLGLTFTAPLDFATIKDVKRGYALDFGSYKDALNQTEISAENDWQQLLTNWANVKIRFALASEIKDIQEKRLKEEGERFIRGKTTTFLLITAENDLDDIILNVYQLDYEELSTAAQAELYNTQPFEGDGTIMELR